MSWSFYMIETDFGELSSLRLASQKAGVQQELSIRFSKDD